MSAPEPLHAIPGMSRILEFGSWATLLAVAALSLPLGGCAMAVGAAAGVAGAGAVALDRRPPATIAHDEAIEWEVRRLLGSGSGFSGGAFHVDVTSYNRVVLLTGEVPEEAAKQAIGRRAGKVADVRSVHNELAVRPAIPFSARANDSWISARIKAALVTTGPPTAPANVRVVTGNGVVFLMGIVTREEAGTVTDVVRRTPGVRQIVRLFEYR